MEGPGDQIDRRSFELLRCNEEFSRHYPLFLHFTAKARHCTSYARSLMELLEHCFATRKDARLEFSNESNLLVQSTMRCHWSRKVQLSKHRSITMLLIRDKFQRPTLVVVVVEVNNSIMAGFILSCCPLLLSSMN